MTISRRMAIAASVAVTLAIAVASLVTYLAVRSQLIDEIDDSLLARAESIQEVSRNLPVPPSRLSELPIRLPATARLGGAAGALQIVTAEGGRRPFPLIDDQSPIPVDQAAKQIAAGERGTTMSEATVDGSRVKVVTAPLDGGGAIQVSRPLDEVDNVLDRLAGILIAITLAGALVAAILGRLVARASLSPVRRFTEQTERAVQGADPRLRIEVDSDDELGRLASTYNSLLDSVARSARSERQLIADASHELRTPLASIRANTELLARAEREGAPAEHERALAERDLKDIRGDLIEQIDDLTVLVEDVVELARDGEPERHSEQIALDRLVEHEAERARRHAPQVGILVTAEPCEITGTPDRIGRAVHNLIDNATKWSDPGDTVEITVGDRALEVRDYGPGFRPEDIPFVFDRFFRSPEARGRRGSGLGLAIVRQVADSAGAGVEAFNHPDGGAVTRIVFPG